MTEWSQELAANPMAPPPVRGLLAFHGVGSGKTVAQAACMRAIQRSCPEATILLLSSGEILDKNMNEIAEALQGIAVEASALQTATACPALDKQARCCRFPRFFASKTDEPGHMFVPHRVDGVTGPYGDHPYDGQRDCNGGRRLTGQARTQADKLWYPSLADTELESANTQVRHNMLPYMGRTVSGVSKGLPRCVALTTAQLDRELQRNNRKQFYTIDFFNRPVVILLDEAHEVFESVATLPFLQKFLQDQSSNVCNLFFTATPGSSPAGMFALTRSLVDFETGAAIASLASSFNDSADRGAVIAQWRQLIRGHVHSYHVLRDPTMFPQLKFVPGVDADNSIMTSKPASKALYSASSDPECAGQPLSFADASAVLSHLRSVFSQGVSAMVSELGQDAVEEAFQTCVRHAHLNDDSCWTTVLKQVDADHKLDDAKRRQMRAFLMRLQGAVMFYANIYNVSKALFEQPPKPVEACATAGYIGASKSRCPFQVDSQLLGFPLQRLRVYSHLTQQQASQGVRGSHTRLKWATSQLRNMDALKKFCPKMARLVEVVAVTQGKQLIACTDRDYYNIGDAMQGVLSNSRLWHKPWVSLVSVLRRVLLQASTETRSALIRPKESASLAVKTAASVSCTTCGNTSAPAPDENSGTRSAPSAEIHRALVQALQTIEDPIYLCMGELESCIRILVQERVFGHVPPRLLRSTVANISTLCRSDWILNKNDGVYNHQSNAEGNLLALVVLNDPSYFTGVNYYGTSAMHIFDPMSFDKVFQFLGRATRMFHRDDDSVYSSAGQHRVRQSISVCVYVYLVLPSAAAPPQHAVATITRTVHLRDRDAAAKLLQSLNDEILDLELQSASNAGVSYEQTYALDFRLRKLKSAVQTVEDALQNTHVLDKPAAKKTEFRLSFNSGLDLAQQAAFAKEYEEVIAMYIAAVQASVNCRERTTRAGYTTFEQEHDTVGALPGGFSLAQIACGEDDQSVDSAEPKTAAAAAPDSAPESEEDGTNSFLRSLKLLWKRLRFATVGLSEQQHMLARQAFGEQGGQILNL